jgi:cold shock CspA family protein/arsenate reductase-like glutaredoxin family protein
MPTGTIKFYHVEKKFGFVTADENGKDVFVPATSLAAAGISTLKAGQRVTFELMADVKGPKAVGLKVLAGAHVPKGPMKNPTLSSGTKGKPKITIYLDPARVESDEALGELRRAGYEPYLVDYIAAPPSKDELKRLSLLLRDSNQSLVRRYEPLFLELRLDDRFIGDNEFWSAIFEHPSLINGPVVATQTRAGICGTKSAVKLFLAGGSSGGPSGPLKRKGLPKSLVLMLTGAAATVLTPQKEVREGGSKKLAAPAAKTMQTKGRLTTKVKTLAKAKSTAKRSAKIKAPSKKVRAKPSTKSARTG